MQRIVADEKGEKWAKGNSEGTSRINGGDADEKKRVLRAQVASCARSSLLSVGGVVLSVRKAPFMDRGRDERKKKL